VINADSRLFNDIYSYKDELQVNHDEYLEDPYLLYPSADKSDTNLISEDSRLFNDLGSYIGELLVNLNEYLDDPYLLYPSADKSGTDLIFNGKYPYLKDMLDTLDQSLYPSVIELDLDQLEIDSQLKKKNFHNTMEFLQAAIAKHNSEYVTLSPGNLQIVEKEIALSK
jgi:hypothetical protein